MLQLTSRPEARGRVMALYGIVFLGSTPIGAPIAGVIGEHLGPRVGFVMSGLVAGGLGLRCCSPPAGPGVPATHRGRVRPEAARESPEARSRPAPASVSPRGGSRATR